MIRVTVTEPGLSARISRFNQSNITIGRNVENDVVLREPFVSAHHGRVQIADGTVVYEDLLSTNGSLVRRNGTLLRVDGRFLHRIHLERGDELLFGPVSQPIVLSVVYTPPNETPLSPASPVRVAWDGWPR